MAQKDHDRAIDDFSRTIQADPRHQWALAYRGECWRIEGEYEKAITDLNEAVRLDAKYVDALYKLGQVPMAQEDCEGAIKEFTRALQVHPKCQGAHAFRGRCWHIRGEYEKAISDLSEAVRRQPRCIYSLHNLGLAASRERNFVRPSRSSPGSSRSIPKTRKLLPTVPHAGSKEASTNRRLQT